MHKNVETLIGRLATDRALRARFAESPEELLAELSAAGLELTDVELAALATTDPEAFRLFAGALDRRLLKAPPSVETPSSVESKREEGAQPNATNQEQETER
jgi:hypothetical protein